MTNGSKSAVRWLFALTLVAFVFQLIGNYVTRSQPYPALAMPGFPGTPTEDGQIDWDVPLVTVQLSDGRRERVSFEHILPADTGVLPSSVFRSNFANEEFMSDPATVSWLQSRIARLFPFDDVGGVEIVWQKAEYNINHNDGGPPYLRLVEVIDLDFSKAQ